MQTTVRLIRFMYVLSCQLMRLISLRPLLFETAAQQADKNAFIV